MPRYAAALRRLWVVPAGLARPCPAPPCARRPSPSHSARAGGPVDMVVVHCTAGSTSSGALSRLLDASARASCHVLIPDPRKGERAVALRLVDDRRKAWHVRREVLFRGQRDVNARSLGIEIVNPGRADTPYAAWQVEEAARWTAYWIDRFPIRFVATHAYLDPKRRADPCATFPWARYIHLVERQLAARE